MADRSEMDALLNAAELEAVPSTPEASKQVMQTSETEHIQH